MDSPINDMIDRASNRKVASSTKAKAKRTKALNDQVLSLVHEANATALPERHVTPRAALIVMARAMKELSSLPDESRNHGVLREVSKFISLNQKTLLASASIKHVDLLPQGHPLSPLNASLSDADLRKKYAEWIAADPAIADEARPLVAMAHSLPPASIEREHAFLRLRTLQASAVPAYFKIDDVEPITAAFMNGNSSAARRARVALQWRDRMGRWIEMGRGINFRFRMPDGSVVTGKGTYVGAGSTPRVERTSKGTSLTSDSGLIEVSGVPGLTPGLYAINSDNAIAYEARIPGYEAPQTPQFKDEFDAAIPSIEDLKAARRDLPIGWKKQGAFYVSDDNYAVIPGPGGQPQSVLRLNSEGRPTGDSVGRVRSWAEVNDAIAKDEPSFDKEIARIENKGTQEELPLARIPGATQEDVVDFQDIVNMQQQRAEENKQLDASRPAAKPLGDKDVNGNVVPKNWTRDPKDDTIYTRKLPQSSGKEYPMIVRVNEDDGTYIAGHKSGWIPEAGSDGRGNARKFTSWNEIDSQGVPDFVDYLNETFTKDDPIILDKNVEASPRRAWDTTPPPGPIGMTLDFADPETAAEDAGLPEDTPFNEIVKAWFDQNIKPVAPTARLEKSEEGGITPSVSITADNEKDLLNAFRAYFGDDEATMEDLRDNATLFERGGDVPERTPEEKKKIEEDLRKNMEKNLPSRKFPQEPRDDRYDARIFSGNYAVSFEALRDEETLTEAGLDPDGEYEDSEILDAWLKAKGLDGRVKVKSLTEGYGGPESVLEIPEEAKADFVKAYGNFEPDVTFDDLVEEGMIEEVSASAPYSPDDITEIDKSVLDALNKKMNSDGGRRGMYEDQNIVFEFPPDYEYGEGTVFMYPRNWEPGMPKIGIIDQDGVIDWQSDAQYDKYSESLREALKKFGYKDTRGKGPDFTNRFKEVKELAESDGTSPKEFFDALFKDAKYRMPTPEELKKYGVPEDSKVFFVDSQNIFVQHTDGTWHNYDLDSPGESIEDEGTYEFFKDEFVKNTGDASVVFYNGAFVDRDLQDAVEEERQALYDGKGPGEPDKFTENKNTGYMEYDLGSGYVVSYGKDEDGNWFTEMNRFSRDGGLDSENSFPAKSEADARAMAEELINRYNDSQGWEGGDGEGPDEPPSPGGGIPPKVPSPSTPGSPALFKDFDAPAGAFQLRTTDYEPEGRIDEASTDFTDDPRRLATKFTLDELVTALTEAVIGRPDDSAMQDILDANVGDNDDLPDLDSLGDIADSPAPRATAGQATGAGSLEFNAGEEFVQAEALYNAVYEAGGDPNRVIANAYDAVNGNRNNVRKLLEAQGGVPSPEETQLIEDMTDEIRQIIDATPDGEISASQKRSKPDKKFEGELIENAPVDFNNPDYYDMDTDAYIPSVPEIDENGYTDNPEILALDYESTDLIEQMIEGITDGSGVALLDFSDGSKYMEGIHEVPVEALRDALQMQGYNTNKILFDLRDESNDMSEPESKPKLSREDIRWDAAKGLYTDVNGKVLDGDTVDAAGLDSSLRDAPAPDIQLLNPEPTPAAERRLPPTTGQRQAPETPAQQPPTPPAERRFPPTTGQRQAIETPTPTPTPTRPDEFSPFADALANLDEEDPSISPSVILSLDETANVIVDLFNYGMQPDMKFLAFNKNNGIIILQNADPLGSLELLSVHPNGGAVGIDANPNWYAGGGGASYGWEPVPDDIAQAIRQENARRFPEYANAPAANAPAEEAAPASPFTYPGPREPGYSANNTTIASNGLVVGAGSIVTAIRDGKRGRVVSIQNNPEYVRIKFDDGKVAVRSAHQIKAVSNPDGSLAVAPSGALAPSAPTPSTDVTDRLKAPEQPVPNIAFPTASWGINDSSSVPEDMAPYTQNNLEQADFSEWGSRAAEIANAGNTRVSLEELFKAQQKVLNARKAGDRNAEAEGEKLVKKLLSDIYGDRIDLSFGAEKFTVTAERFFSSQTGDLETGNGDAVFNFSIAFTIKDKNGREIGEGGRAIHSKIYRKEDGSLGHDTYVENKILRIRGANKKRGFATAYNRYMENWYIANKIGIVQVYAAGGQDWVGGFVWAVNGFDWRDFSTADSAMMRLKRYARSPEEKEIVKRLSDRLDAADQDVARVPTPLEFALAGWYPGADNWLGKEVMSGFSWNGVKRLNPNYREQKQALNYNQIKSADRRIKAGQNKANMSSTALAQVMGNDFQLDNPELSPYMEQIRDALKNNRPLGFLSPAAKSALNSYVSKELLNKDSNMPMEDMFRLRNALDAEYRADYDFADPFAGINEELTRFTLEDFRDNSDALKAAGFEARELGKYESGQNTTFRVVHKPSGQVFFVKEEHLSKEYDGARGLVNETEANVLLNALGMHGMPDVRGSLENPDVFIMSQAGATLPLTAAPINAEKMFYEGIADTNGQKSTYPRASYLDALSNPEDIFSMAIVDIIGDSEDRHDGNWMVAFDNSTGKMRIFPIDHGLIRINPDNDSLTPRNLDSSGEVYQRVIPRLLDMAGEARAKEIFLNQIDKLIRNLDDPLFQPRGESLAALVEKWGSYDAFKDAIKLRLTNMATPGTSENTELNNIMKKSYWR